MTTPTPFAPEELPELMPCPFNSDHRVEANGAEGTFHHWFGIGCTDQYCPAYRRALVHKSMAAAVEAWNRRAARQEAAPATQQAAIQKTPALKRHALEAAKALSEYAAAPFFPDTEKRGKVRPTSADWWDGLAELIEETQRLIARALRECTEPLQQAAGDAERDAARWRGVKARHGMSLVRLATGGSGYSSAKKDGILDAWADMACAEVDAFDSEAFQADMRDRIAELEGDAARTAQADQDTAPGAEKGAPRNNVWKGTDRAK